MKQRACDHCHNERIVNYQNAKELRRRQNAMKSTTSWNFWWRLTLTDWSKDWRLDKVATTYEVLRILHRNYGYKIELWTKLKIRAKLEILRVFPSWLLVSPNRPPPRYWWVLWVAFSCSSSRASSESSYDLLTTVGSWPGTGVLIVERCPPEK